MQAAGTLTPPPAPVQHHLKHHRAPQAAALLSEQGFSWPLPYANPKSVIADPCYATSYVIKRVSTGMAKALHTLLVRYGEMEGVWATPICLNERIHPLCNAASPIISFEHTDLFLLNHGYVPSPVTIYCFVSVVVECLDLTPKELTVALVILENIICGGPGVFRVHTVRPLFIAACIVALKFTLDERIRTAECYLTLRKVFTAMTAKHTMRIEATVLAIIGYSIPQGSIYQAYANSLWAEGEMPIFGLAYYYYCDDDDDNDGHNAVVPLLGAPPPNVFAAHELQFGVETVSFAH